MRERERTIKKMNRAVFIHIFQVAKSLYVFSPSNQRQKIWNMGLELTWVEERSEISAIRRHGRARNCQLYGQLENLTRKGRYKWRVGRSCREKLDVVEKKRWKQNLNKKRQLGRAGEGSLYLQQYDRAASGPASIFPDPSSSLFSPSFIPLTEK